MDIEYKRLYLKYKKKYLELKQSGGSFSDKQQTALDKILNYFAGGLDYDALRKKLSKDELYTKIKDIDENKIPKSEVQYIKEEFKDKTGLSYEAVNSYLEALQYKKEYDDIEPLLKKSKYGHQLQQMNKALQSYKKKFNEETTVKENGLDFDSILKALEQKKDADDAAEE